MAVLNRGLIVSWIVALAAAANACEAGDVSMQTPQTQAASTAALTVDEIVGLWRVRAVSGPESCLIALNRLAKGSGYGVHIENCTVPVLSSAVDWRLIPGGFELRAKSGAVVARFQMVDVDHFASVEAGYRMERATIS